NQTAAAAAATIVGTGWQVLHITGQRDEFTDPAVPGYHAVDYCDRMDLALAAADFAISRAGSATVSELTALGIPAAYVPYPVGNGEQAFNARGVVEAGGGKIVKDRDFDPEWIESVLLPLLTDADRVAAMGSKARSVGLLDGTARMVELIEEMLA